MKKSRFKKFKSLAARTPKVKNSLYTSNRQFPELSDPASSVVNKLKKRYAAIKDNASVFCTTPASLAAFTKASFSDVSLGGRAYAVDPKNPEAHYNKDITDLAITTIDKPAYKIKIDSNSVEMPLESIEVYTSEVRLTEDNVEILQNKLDTMFGKGKAKIPNRIEYDKTAHLKISNETVETGFQPISYFTRLNMENVSNSMAYAPEKFEPLEKVPTKIEDSDINFSRMIAMNVELEHILVNNSFMYKEGMPLAGARIAFFFKVTTQITYPMMYALWLTHATQAKDFVPKLFVEQTYKIYRAAMIPGARLPAGFERTMHLGIVKDMNVARMEEYDIKPIPRVDKDGFTVLSNGRICYVPDIDNTKKYTDILRASYNPSTHEIKPNAAIPEIKNLPIYTDWINDAIGYTNADGTPNSISLHGAVPLSSVTIGKIIKTYKVENFSYNGEESSLSFFAKNFRKFGEETCSRFSLYDHAFISSDYMRAVAASFEGLTLYLSKYEEETLLMLFNGVGAGDAGRIVEDHDVPLIEEWRRLCQKINDKFMEMDHIAYSNRLYYKIWYHIIGNCTRDPQSFLDAVSDGVDKNKAVTNKEAKVDFQIPNLPGIKNVLPHQARFFTASENSPEFMSIGAAPGGGKTFMIAGDILKQIELKKAKKPIIVVPGVLVKEYCNELNKYSQGHVNAVPLTASTVKRLIKNLGFTKKRFLNYIRKSPPNTIFITSYNFMKAKTDYFDGYRAPAIQFGEDIIPFYPMAQILRAAGFDIISLDESHFIKNETSGQTKAVKFLTPTIPMRRNASGTIDIDNPSDSVSQIGIFDPSILKTKSHFIGTYGISDGTDKFRGWRKGGVAQYFNDIAPYYSRYEANKVDWSQLLPKIKVSLVSTVMTKNQQIFYEFLLNSAIEKIEKDKALSDLLEKGDESDEAQSKVEMAIRQSLQNAESFIYAPDENAAFESYIREKGYKFSKEDKISCDVNVIDSIIEKHFASGNKNKIIVTFINRAASRHALKYSKYRDKSVHYAVESPMVVDKKTGEVADGPKGTGDANLEKFRDPDDRNALVLFADITSIRAGLNLQIADTMIRTQTPWSPGEATQEESRIIRPDVYNVFGREDVKLYWLMVERSHVTAKIARLISKTVMIHEKNTHDNLSWSKWKESNPMPDSEKIPPIKMNLEQLHTLVQSVQSGISHGFQPGTSNDYKALMPYFHAYENIGRWEDGEFDKNIQQLKEITANRLGIDPEKLDNIKLRTASMLSNDGTRKIEGSKSIYVPLEAGTIPVDKRGLNLMPLARVKEKVKDEDSFDDDDELGIIEDEDDADEDDEKAEIEDNAEINVGDIVQTEYGMGEIVQIRAGRNGRPGTSVKVHIPGMDNITEGKPISINKRLVFMPKPPVIDPDNPKTIDAHAQWEANVAKLKKDYAKAKASGVGITFINGMDLEVKPAKPEIEIKKPVPPKKNNNVNEKPHPGADESGEEATSRDPLLDKLYKEFVNKKQNKDKLPTKAPPKRSREKLDVDIDIVNGMVAVQFYTDDNMYTPLEKFDKGLYEVPKFAYVHIDNYQGAVDFMDMVDENFTLPADIVENGKVTAMGTKAKILALAYKMRMKKTKSSVLHLGDRGSQIPFSKNLSNFFKIGHTPPRNNSGKRPGIKMYPTIWEDNLYICFPISTQKKQIQKLRQLCISNKAKLKTGTNVGPLSTVDDCAVKLFHTPAQAIEYLDKIANKFSIDNLQDLMKKLKAPATKRLLSVRAVDTSK